jgi:hypothetical protein
MVNILADSAFYSAPGGNQTEFRVHATENWLAVYRSADNKWVAVYTNGNVLGWLPASLVSGPYTILPMRVTRIERVYVNGVPDGLIFYSCGAGGEAIAVHNGPSVDAPVLGGAETGTAWRVIGQAPPSAQFVYDEFNQWIRIDFNGQAGWILYVSDWVCLLNGSIDDIPVIKP